MINRLLTKNLYIGILCALLSGVSGCGENSMIGPYKDPYLDAFRNKRIRYMVSHKVVDPLNDIHLIDTSWFDERGNITRFAGYGLREQRAYDSLNFQVRYLKRDDIPKNFWIRYSEVDGVLIQQWNELNHLKWDFKPEDAYSIYDTVKFVFDGRGNVLQQTDVRTDERIIFHYDESERLIRKEMYSIKTGEDAGIWTYTYSAQGEIETIFLRYQDFDLTRHYYHDGLLDSTRTLKGLTTYTYVFR